MGEVYRATDAVLERAVAIKVLHMSLAGDREFVERFRREARAAANLNHPNIVGVHDWGAVDGIYYMVMEYVRGQSLREILDAEGVLAPAQAVDVLLQTLSALDVAHRSGIVHRDVKPENMMVTRDGVVKVTDFGLARAFADAHVTEAGRVSGTVQYLAPEQLQGEPADPRTDLYSLGVVAYELLTGRLPFTGETALAIAYRHIRERVPPPSRRNPTVPEVLDGWVASMTEKERELRPESAAEARRDLQREVDALPPAAPIRELVEEVITVPAGDQPERATTVTIERKHGSRRRRRGRWILGALFAILAIGAGAWGVWTYLVPHSVRVPQLAHERLAAARAELARADLAVRIADGRYSPDVAKGSIVSVRPSAGTELRTGSVVTLIPSLGPPPVEVPNLVGLTLPQARTALEKAGLELGAHPSRFDPNRPVGRIVSQDAKGAERPQGSAIDVVVSKGPPPIPVPKVVGKTEDQAKAALGQFSLVVSTDYSDSVPRGAVISQDPAPKSNLQPGGQVHLVVSLGPRTFPVPSFTGLSRDEAVARIRSVGLVPSVYPVPGSSGTTVVSQLPSAGTIVKAGSTITIYIA